MKKRIPIVEVTIALLVIALIAVVAFAVVGKNNNGGQVSSNNGSSVSTEKDPVGDSGNSESNNNNNNNNNSENDQPSNGDVSGEDTEVSTENGSEENNGNGDVVGGDGTTDNNNGNGNNNFGGGSNDEINVGDIENDYEVDEDEFDSSTTDEEKWQEGDIEHNGKHYRYNNKIKTYLIMGIDKDTAGTVTGATNGGQSDAMFLLVVDSKNNKLSVVSINRNTMTYVFKYDANGKKTGILKAQICIQHGYGDGKNLSCSRAANAVSILFNNIPIHGYLSLRMGAIPILNDAVGGVEVEVLNNLSYGEVNLKKGEIKTLMGMESYWYLRGRSKTQFDSATDRLRRQEQYIKAFINQTKEYTGSDVSKIVSIYDSIEKYVVTNMDFADLAEDLVKYNYADAKMYTVPGKTIMGEKYEEYHVDKEKLYDMIIDIFYNRV